MCAVFHARSTTADVTDFEFYIHANWISGTFEPGMLVRFRPHLRLLRSFVLHSIEPDEWFTAYEGRPVYRLLIQCGSLEATEYLYRLRIEGEDFELVMSPDH